MSPVESGRWTRRSRFSQASSLAGTTACLTERRPGVIGTARGLVGHRFETGNGNATSWGGGGLWQRPAMLKSREALAETVLASRSSRASVEPCHSHADSIFLFVVLGGFQNAFTGRVEPRRNPVRCVRRVGAQ